MFRFRPLWFLFCLCGGTVFTSLSLPGATFSVSNTNDTGPGSFRAALLDANAAAGLDTVTFQIPGAPPHLISPKTVFPAITDPIVIDGASQVGFFGQPLVRLDGPGAGAGSDGLRLLAGHSTVRGLIITRFGGDGIRIEGAGTNIIEGNYIGIGYSGVGDLGNGEGGITIYRSSGNRIGGTSLASRNVISGGNLSGIYLIDAAATRNEILGNFIGTDPSGTVRRGNQQNGIVLSQSPANVIGGLTAAARNVISGNSMSGIYLLGTGTRENVILGNYIGTSATGNLALSNQFDGITLSGASKNVIGGTASGAGNVISGNHERGIYITLNSHENVVQGNLIGTDSTGTADLGNMANGVAISAGSSNRIGGSSVTMRNLISGNNESGVLLFGTNTLANAVQGNFIGVDWTGTNRLSNTFNGINISGAIGNGIGGILPGEGNLISGNGQAGIFIGTAFAQGNKIQGNLIGTDATGQKTLGNKTAGVWVESPGNLLGGNLPSARNVISGNQESGVFLLGIAATNNRIHGNLIGTDADGSKAVANSHAGIGLTNATGNFIGGAGSGEGNVVSGNVESGIYLLGINTTNNRFQGNYIGTDVSGTAAVPNGVGGIYFYSSGKNWIGGTNAGEGNVISGNFKVGIAIGSPGANSNVVQGNLIGTAADGHTPLGNQWHGIELLNTSSNNIIGGVQPGAANRIAYAKTSQYAGVRVRDGCFRNSIRGNIVFSNAGLGIDLGVNGVNTPATPGGWQQFPIITSATGLYVTSVQGTLAGTANRNYTVDFYANPINDPSGNGEGFRWLGSTTVTPAASGIAAFSLAFTNPVPVGRFISATATDSTNNSSEFSAWYSIPALDIDTDGDGMSDNFEMATQLNPLLADDAFLDADGDGMNNLAEFIAGTDPNNADSALRLNFVVASGFPVDLSFPSVAGRRYALEASHDLSAGWSPLPGATNLTGTGFPIAVKDAAPGLNNTFYRVHLLP